MKHSAILPVTAMLLVLASMLPSCKTSEDNYRKAYQAAVEKQNEAYTGEEVSLMAREEAIPRTLFRGDSIPMKGLHVNTVKLDPPVEVARRYNVVVACFKQQFNAKSVLSRLREAGYPDGRLLIDRDQTYYVAPVSTDSLAEAVDALRRFQSSSPVPVRSPFPYILRKP